MVLQGSLLVTLVQLVDRLPMPACQTSEGDAIRWFTLIGCS